MRMYQQRLFHTHRERTAGWSVVVFMSFVVILVSLWFAYNPDSFVTYSHDPSMISMVTDLSYSDTVVQGATVIP